MEIHLADVKDLLDEDRARLLVRVRSPGRINLIGEHTDYNGGSVLPFAIEPAVEVCIHHTALPIEADLSSLSFDVTTDIDNQLFSVTGSEILSLISAFSADPSHREVLASLPESIHGTWCAYVVGSLWTLARYNERACATLRRGKHLVVNISSTLPVGAGISSSAALSTALLAAFAEILDVSPDLDAIARMAMTIEHRFIGTNCGLMDQLAVVHSQQNAFTHINFREFPENGTFSIENIQPHSIFADYSLVAINTGVKHSLAHSPYNERRESCARALELLNAFTGQPAKALGTYSDNHLIGVVFGPEINQNNIKTHLINGPFAGDDNAHILAARASHAIYENVRVRDAIIALQSGLADQLDLVMQESHISLRDDYEVSCEELDTLCSMSRSIAHKIAQERGVLQTPILGPRMTGGGFGGSTIQLVHNNILTQFLECINNTDNIYHQRFAARLIPMQVKPSVGLTQEI